MDNKQLKKLTLKKTVISRLSAEEQASVQGGFTSSGNCTGFLCCDGGPGASNTPRCCSEATLMASCGPQTPPSQD